MNGKGWVYLSAEYAFLKSHKDDSIEFNTFDAFWHSFNRNSYLVPPDGQSEKDIEEFKTNLKANALEIYNTFKGKENA